VLGRVLALTGQGDRAIAVLEKSVALNPSFAQGYYALGHTLNWYCRAADGIPILDMAMRLSPHDPMLWGMQSTRATCCISLENYDEAVEWAHKVLSARPDLLWPHLELAVALAGQDRLDEARLAVEAAARPDASILRASGNSSSCISKWVARAARIYVSSSLP